MRASGLAACSWCLRLGASSLQGSGAVDHVADRLQRVLRQARCAQGQVPHSVVLQGGRHLIRDRPALSLGVGKKYVGGTPKNRDSAIRCL
jgi:hypothetical protein